MSERNRASLQNALKKGQEVQKAYAEAKQHARKGIIACSVGVVATLVNPAAGVVMVVEALRQTGKTIKNVDRAEKLEKEVDESFDQL